MNYFRSNYKSVTLWVALLFFNISVAQIDFTGNVSLEGYYSNQEELPFWFYSNQRGRISEETNVAGWISGKMNYDLSTRSSLEIGGGVFYQDAFTDEVFVDELYVDLKYDWFQFIVGRKQEDELYKGLSATNENFAWSLNARPMPGVQVQTSRPVYFGERENLGFEFSWEEYLMGKDRFVQNARLHTKSLYLVANLKNNWQLKAGISHFAQWAGDSPESGPQPEGFTDYLKVVTGREGAGNAVEEDQTNVLGNHLGTYEIYLSKAFGMKVS